MYVCICVYVYICMFGQNINTIVSSDQENCEHIETSSNYGRLAIIGGIRKNGSKSNLSSVKTKSGSLETSRRDMGDVFCTCL